MIYEQPLSKIQKCQSVYNLNYCLKTILSLSFCIFENFFVPFALFPKFQKAQKELHCTGLYYKYWFWHSLNVSILSTGFYYMYWFLLLTLLVLMQTLSMGRSWAAIGITKTRSLCINSILVDPKEPKILSAFIISTSWDTFVLVWIFL